MADPIRVIVLVPSRGTVAAELLTALVNNLAGYDLVLRMVNR